MPLLQADIRNGQKKHQGAKMTDGEYLCTGPTFGCWVSIKNNKIIDSAPYLKSCRGKDVKELPFYYKFEKLRGWYC